MTTAPAPPLLEDTPLGPRAGGLYRRQNALVALGLGLGLGLLGWAAAHVVLQGGNRGTDRTVTVAMVCWVVGFNIGIGTLNAPLDWVRGRVRTGEDELYAAGVGQGRWRYWKYCTDHKVVGVQYLVLVTAMFGVGGGLAMLIRTQLLTPHSEFLNPNSYNAVVSIHGMIMIMAAIIMVTGPFANFILPIMIGARDMAFPRMNAMSMWLVVSCLPCLLVTFALGGVDAGWTTYAPLSIQAPTAMDAFAIAILVFAVSVTVAGVNLIVTVLTMRAPGMTFGRMPIFSWGSLVANALSLFAMPAFLLVMLMVLSDRVLGTSLLQAAVGGSGWLYENVFWIMGHPEVYVILIPPAAALLEVVATFARKPVFAYRMVVAAFVAIGLLSLVVWAHHMFTSGWAPDLAPPFMLTTELISIPTGIIVMCIIGTLWRGTIWTRLPMFFAYLFLWDFIIGGVSGIYLSDVPADQFFHGDMFVTAHLHYTLLGGAMIAAAGALCYWFPKITGRILDERLGKAAFWVIAVGIQVTFVGQFWAGLKGMPRRVAYYDPTFLRANQMATVGAYLLMAGWIVFLYALVHSARHGRRSGADPWRSRTLEWKVPSPVPLENFAVLPVVTSDPYGYGEPDPPGPVPEADRPADAGGVATVTTTAAGPVPGADGTGAGVTGPGDAEAGQQHHRALLGVWLLIAGDAVFLVLEVFTWFYLRALDTNGLWRGARCSRAHPCFVRQGLPILGEVPTAGPLHPVVIALLSVGAALVVWAAERACRRLGPRRDATTRVGLAMVVVAVAGLVQLEQFASVPFTRMQGSYASMYFFLMASTLVHLAVAGFACLGGWVRARTGLYDQGRWSELRLIRLVVAWVAVATCVSGLMVTLFT